MLVLQEARIETRESLFKLIQDTREHHLLFSAEIGEYIDVLYKKGTRLHSMWLASGPRHIIRPDAIQEETQIRIWFTGPRNAEHHPPFWCPPKSRR